MAMMLSAEICIFAILKTVMSNLIQNIQKSSLVWPRKLKVDPMCKSNKFNNWSFHGILNTLGLVNLCVLGNLN